jgi:genome maintenance exonuclease 1
VIYSFFSDVFANGTNLHSCIERYLTGQKDRIEIRPGNEGHWESIEHVLQDVTGVQFVEHAVRHPDLKYSGIVDCIAEYRSVGCYNVTY